MEEEKKVRESTRAVVDYDEDLLGLNEDECKDMLKKVDMYKMRLDVFRLFDINPGIDAQLALRRVQILECQNDESL